MGDYTPRSGIYLMGGGSTGLILPDEPVDVDKINSNMRIIDNLLGARNIPSASSYGGTMDGDLVYTQDTGYLHMYSAADTALINPRLPGARMYSGTRAQRMAFIPRAKEGDLWRDTDNIGALWALNGASPGVWEYSGNRMRGTKAAMDQMVTDGIVVEGMYATCTDDNSDYVCLSGAWTVQLADSGWINATIIGGTGGTGTNTAAYRRKNGIVYLKGMWTPLANSETAFILPDGFRPFVTFYAQIDRSIPVRGAVLETGHVQYIGPGGDGPIRLASFPPFPADL